MVGGWVVRKKLKAPSLAQGHNNVFCASQNFSPETRKFSRTYRWSCRLNAFEHTEQEYFRSSLWISLCFASALELLKFLLQIGHCIMLCADDELPAPPLPSFAGRPLLLWPIPPLLEQSEDVGNKSTPFSGNPKISLTHQAQF